MNCADRYDERPYRQNVDRLGRSGAIQNIYNDLLELCELGYTDFVVDGIITGNNLPEEHVYKYVDICNTFADFLNQFTDNELSNAIDCLGEDIARHDLIGKYGFVPAFLLEHQIISKYTGSVPRSWQKPGLATLSQYNELKRIFDIGNSDASYIMTTDLGWDPVELEQELEDGKNTLRDQGYSEREIKNFVL